MELRTWKSWRDYAEKLEADNERLKGRLRDILNCGVLTPECSCCAKKNAYAHAALQGE